MIKLDNWLDAILADPITKQPKSKNEFLHKDGILDARIYLKNTSGYRVWGEGQKEYEDWSASHSDSFDERKNEIEIDRSVYTYFPMSGRILDCGGGGGLVREFLSDDVQYISIDPWIRAPYSISDNSKKAYSCLKKPLNFIAATAEFLPFSAETFNWVHMRSMLDHVQLPDLVLLEAYRVLRPNGKLLVGLYVEGGKMENVGVYQQSKNIVKSMLGYVGIDRWKDHHVWHPTYSSLKKLITDNGFIVEDTYWQPGFNNNVCYISAKKVDV